MRKVVFAIAVILILIASCSKKSAPIIDAARVIDATAVFSKNCARCHGAQGVNDNRTPNLKTIALDKPSLIKSIAYGKGQMPAFEDNLSMQEISAVADLIVGWHAK